MSIRTTNIKIKVLADWKGIPAGTIARAKSVGFGCRITDGEYANTEIGKAKYKVLKVLPNEIP